MKITAEFNSNEELISFLKAFNPNALEVTTNNVTEVKAPVINVGPKEVQKIKEEVVKNIDKASKVDKAQDPKEEIKEDKPKEEIKEEVSPEVAPEEDKKEEPKVTMEMVRAKLSELLAKGKQKEAKTLLTKFGASKLPEVKEEDLPAVLEEAEALLNG